MNKIDELERKIARQKAEIEALRTTCNELLYYKKWQASEKKLSEIKAILDRSVKITVDSDREV